MNRHYFLLLLLIVPALINADNGKTAWQAPDKPIYVVTENHYAEGFTPDGNTARFGDLIAIQIFNPKANSNENEGDYKIGERIALFTGGQRRGEIKIKNVVPLQCDASTAQVSAAPSVHLAKGDMALATNSEKIRTHVNIQRPPTTEETQYAIQLSMNIFRKHGLTQASPKDIKSDHLVVTKLDESGALFFVGEFEMNTKIAGHELFLIGKLEAAGATTEFARYHRFTDLEDGTDSESVQFVDQLDFDGDGTDEVVVEVRGYENEEFAIYRRQNGQWRQVHVGGQGGC